MSSQTSTGSGARGALAVGGDGPRPGEVAVRAPARGPRRRSGRPTPARRPRRRGGRDRRAPDVGAGCCARRAAGAHGRRRVASASLVAANRMPADGPSTRTAPAAANSRPTSAASAGGGEPERRRVEHAARERRWRPGGRARRSDASSPPNTGSVAGTAISSPTSRSATGRQPRGVSSGWDAVIVTARPDPVRNAEHRLARRPRRTCSTSSVDWRP